MNALRLPYNNFHYLSLSKKEKFVTYHNLSNALPKMGKLLKKFEFTSFDRYLKSN